MKHTSNYFIKEVYFKSILFGQKKYIWCTFEKKRMEILSVYTSVPKIMIICYTVPEIWHMMNIISIFHFELFFVLLLPWQPEKPIFSKNAKKPGDIIILYMCTKNYDQMMHSSWDMVCDRWKERKMDRWTDGCKKWHIKVDAPPKISFLKQQK